MCTSQKAKIKVVIAREGTEATKKKLTELKLTSADVSLADVSAVASPGQSVAHAKSCTASLLV